MAETGLEKRQEVEVVTTAYFLEENISRLKKENTRLHNNRPPEPTAPPEPKLKKTKISPIPYPEVDAQIGAGDNFRGYFKSYNKKFVLGCIAAFILFSLLKSEAYALLSFAALLFYILMKRIFWMFIGKSTVKEQKEEQIKNTPEYKARCREIDEENRRRQEQLDRELHEQYLKECEQHKIALAQHEEEMKRYRGEILPAWEEEVSALEKALNDTQAALQELYDRRVIPIQYRTIPALYYLATFVGTSSYDLTYAIERYDSYVLQCQQREQISLQQAQIMLMKEISRNQQYTNWLNEQMTGMLEQGNTTLQSINSWQKADLAIRAYWRFKDRREQRAGK